MCGTSPLLCQQTSLSRPAIDYRLIDLGTTIRVGPLTVSIVETIRARTCAVFPNPMSSACMTALEFVLEKQHEAETHQLMIMKSNLEVWWLLGSGNGLAGQKVSLAESECVSGWNEQLPRARSLMALSTTELLLSWRLVLVRILIFNFVGRPRSTSFFVLRTTTEPNHNYEDIADWTRVGMWFSCRRLS